MPKKKTRSKLVAAADKIFSEYIRRRYANKLGVTECFTCGKVDHWKKLQCVTFSITKTLQYSLGRNELSSSV